jgi:glycine cleavage system H lipoate-binding protein/ABC-type phosphate transport system substrate-binding protein
MKKKFLLFVGFILLYPSFAISKEVLNKDNTVKGNTITISCSPDLYDLTKQWTSAYCKFNPSTEINLITANPDVLGSKFNSGVNLGFISNRYYPSIESVSNSLWVVVIGRDIIVPIINSKNPFIDKINQQGISSFELAEIFKSPQTQNWRSLIENGENAPLNYYLIANESVKSDVANFMNVNQINIKGIEVNIGKELVTAVQNDPYAIGFCKLTDIINSGNQDFVDNIKLLPIDKNGNGQIDYFEKIYGNLNDFSRGVWIGKYPKTLICELYSVSNGIPKNETEVAFLKWVLTEGQQIVVNNGFSELVYNERQTKLEKLNDHKIYAETTKHQYALKNILFLIFIVFMVFLAGGLFVNVIVRKRRNNIKTQNKGLSNHPKVINENSLTVPNGLYFDKTHTWVFMEKVGIDDFLQHITGPYSHLKMKNPGDKIKKNEQILSLIQNGKHLNIYAAISGTIIDINEHLITDPSMINRSPYAEGWVYMIEPSNWLREIQFLRMAERYKEWIQNEFSKLKDFLAVSVHTKTAGYAHVAFQEGGELEDNVLQYFGPEVWEDFQKNFIDTAGLR